ncbi:MAG: hypothetical protein ACYTFO_08265, partial [Planctomycetota bacterium]
VKGALRSLSGDTPPSPSTLLDLCNELRDEVSFIQERAGLLIAGAPASDLVHPTRVLTLFKQLAQACGGIEPIELRDAWGAPLFSVTAELQWPGEQMDRAMIDVIGDLEGQLARLVEAQDNW